MWRFVSVAGLAAAMAAWSLGASAGDGADSPREAPGEQVDYNRFCLPCHGVRGNGRGPAASLLWPPARELYCRTVQVANDPEWATTYASRSRLGDSLRCSRNVHARLRAHAR